MHSTLRPYVTAGAVIVGAGLIAVTPLAAPLPHINTVRDVALTAGPGADAFTIDDTTFDPGSSGYNDFGPFVGVAPLLKIGAGTLWLFGNHANPSQDLEVYDSGGTDLGTAHTSVNASDLLGIDSAQFTVQAITPPVADIQAALTGSDLDFSGGNFTVSELANSLTVSNVNGPLIPFGSDISSNDVFTALTTAGINLSGTDITDADIAGVLNGIDVSALDLPDVGTVYSITNLGSGWANVYEAVPNADGTAASHITDTLVTPFGNINVPTDYDAVAHLAPGAAFAGLGATSDNSSASDHAFTIDGTTFDPGSDGFTPVKPLLGVAPLLELGGGESVFGSFHFPLATQNLEVYGASGTDLGSVTTSVNTQNLLGIDATQLTVTAGTPTDPASVLPADGTVYSVTNLGSGWENVYIATPNADGTAAASITDTFVTPYGNFDIPTTFDAIAPMDAGAPFAGLGVTSDDSSLSDNAFTIDGTTFDPGSAGFTPLLPLSGNAPLLEIGGGFPVGPTVPAATQDLDVYGSSGTELGSIHTAVSTSNLLGLIDTTQLNVTGTDPAQGVDATDLPAVGTVYSVTDFGGGFENVYEAVPNAAGTAAAHITDTLVTPFGNVDLSTMFDAIAALDPGDAAAGVSTSATSGFDLFDPSTWF